VNVRGGQRATLPPLNMKDGTHEETDERPLGETNRCGWKVPIQIQESNGKGNAAQQRDAPS
jgi:hypothetical protein